MQTASTIISPAPDVLRQIPVDIPDPAPNSPFSLNNDRCSAPPCDISDIIKYIPLPPGELSRHNGQDAFFSTSESPDKKKSLLRSLIRRLGFDDFKYNYWQLQYILRRALAAHAGITNSTFQPFREYNFLNCFKKYSSGQVLTVETSPGQTEKVVQKMYCGNKYCSLCTTKKRQSIAAEYTSLARQAHERYGMEKIWSFVFTLPENLEADLFDQAKILRAKINGILKKVFAVRTRDNLGVVISTHPVGDNDIFRKRLHFHAIVFPLWINKKNEVGIIKRDRISVPDLKNQWAKILPPGADPIPPQVKYITLSSGNEFKNVGHLVKYTIRSFANTLENSITSHSADCSALALKADHDCVCDWRIVPIAHFAEQYIWVLDNNTIQPYGWLRNIKKWRSEGIFEEQAIENRPVLIESQECVIEFERYKTFSRRLKQIVWVRKDYCYVLGVKYEIGKDIKYY